MQPSRNSLQPLSPTLRARFASPNTDAPLDVDTEVAGIPQDATISGMFLMPMAAEAARLGSPLPSARDRYTRFNFYPLREHVRLMFEAVTVLFPGVSTQKGIRKLGRGAAPALLESTLGRVVLASAITPHDALEAIAKAYTVNLKPGTARVTDAGLGFAIVELKDIFYLLDSNHVGVLEGLMRPFDLQPEVRVALLAPGHAEMLVTWPV